MDATTNALPVVGVSNMAAASDLAVYGAAIAAAYAASYGVAKRFMPNAPCFAVAGDAIFGLVYYPLLVVLAFDACCDLHVDARQRWMGTTVSSATLGKLLTSRMIVHMPYLLLKESPEEVARRPGYMVHHCIVVVAYGAGVFRSLAHFWGAAAALCEATNIFLTVDEALMSWPKVYAELVVPRQCLQLGFQATYVVFRLALFPAILCVMCADARSMAAADFARLGVFELLVFPASLSFVLALSVSWAAEAFRAPRPKAA